MSVKQYRARKAIITRWRKRDDKLTGLTRSSAHVQLCLRQHDTSHFVCISFLRSQSAKTKYKKKESTAANALTRGTAYDLKMTQ